MAKRKAAAGLPAPSTVQGPAYDEILSGISQLLEAARRTAARSINSIMTVVCQEIGRLLAESRRRKRCTTGI